LNCTLAPGKIARGYFSWSQDRLSERDARPGNGGGANVSQTYSARFSLLGSVVRAGRSTNGLGTSTVCGKPAIAIYLVSRTEFQFLFWRHQCPQFAIFRRGMNGCEAGRMRLTMCSVERSGRPAPRTLPEPSGDSCSAYSHLGFYMVP